MTTLNRYLGKTDLTIVGIENPIFEKDEESIRIWFEIPVNPGKWKVGHWQFCVSARLLVNQGVPIITALKQCTGSSSLEAMIGKQVSANVLQKDDGDLIITTVKTFEGEKIMNVNINQGKNFLQVEDCYEGQSQTTGNEYWVLKCTVLPDPKVGRQNEAPLETINVYFMKKFDWALQNLQDIVVACGSDKPWNLFGRKFIADVVVKNDFVSLRKPRPYSEAPETSEAPGPRDINARSEWPF